MRQLLAACMAAFLWAPPALAGELSLLKDVTATGAGSCVPGNASPVSSKTYQITGSTSSGSGSAVVVIEGSNTSASWDTIWSATLTLSASVTSYGLTSLDRYKCVRGNVTTLTGTGAAVSATQVY